jgi:hypothetical protein
MPAITDPRTRIDSVHPAHPGANDGPAVCIPSRRFTAGDREPDGCYLLHRMGPIRPQSTGKYFAPSNSWAPRSPRNCRQNWDVLPAFAPVGASVPAGSGNDQVSASARSPLVDHHVTGPPELAPAN